MNKFTTDSKYDLDKEVYNFAMNMQKQLDINTELKNQNWHNYTDIKNILIDIEYHKAKLLMALKEDNPGAIAEYIADCANILMFLGAAIGMYNHPDHSKNVYEMVTPLFKQTTVEMAVLKKEMDNL